MSEYSTFAHITKNHEGLCSSGSDGIDAADSYTSVEQLTAVCWQIYLKINKPAVKLNNLELRVHHLPEDRRYISEASAGKNEFRIIDNWWLKVLKLGTRQLPAVNL